MLKRMCLVLFTGIVALSGWNAGIHAASPLAVNDPGRLQDVGMDEQQLPAARCFPETNQCISGRFREYWEQNGGLDVFGYPVTDARPETNRDTSQSYLTQWFERNRFELHPENGRPYDVLLGRLGDDRLTQVGIAWEAFAKERPKPGCTFFQETGFNVCEPFRTYWLTHGLDLGVAGVAEAESRALIGLPISPLLPSARPRQVVVFLRGIGTASPEELLPPTASCDDQSSEPTFRDIRQGLLKQGFTCADFLNFSYRGGTVQNGAWRPHAYDCESTGQHVDTSIKVLQEMLHAYRQAHPYTQFVLVGHSLGGFIALQATRLLEFDPLLRPGSIAAVVTVDSPVGYASQANQQRILSLIPPNARGLNCQLRVFDSDAARDIGILTPDNSSQIAQERREFVRLAQSRGVQVMTIGNEDDCLWRLSWCNMPGGGWQDDRLSMVIDTAKRQQLYPLGSRGCELSGANDDPRKLECLGDRLGPHAITLHARPGVPDVPPGIDVPADIAGFVGQQAASVPTQWFERTRFESHPENPNPYKVQLGLLGMETR